MRHLSEATLEQAAVDGLPASEVLRVMEHLGECTSCQCRLESIQFWSRLQSGVFGTRNRTIDEG